MGIFSQTQYEISKMSKGARLIFEENPYCILGLPCNASKTAALDRRDKLAKLSKLGASNSFVSEYDLSDVEKPNRDLGNVQVAISRLDQLDNTWLWFSTYNCAKTWQTKKDIFGKYVVPKSYDELLAAYIFALVTDSSFQNTNLWTIIVAQINTYLRQCDSEMFKILSSRINPDERVKYSDEAIIRSFVRTIEKPLHAAIDELDGQAILRIFKDKNTYSFLHEKYSDNLKTRLLNWVSEKLVPVSDSREKYNAKGNHVTSKEETEEALRALSEFTEEYYPTCAELKDYLDRTTSDMMMFRIKEQFYTGVNPLLTGGKKVEACKYESLIFMYCNDYEKSQIKAYSPLEHLDIPDSEFTADECRTIALTFKYEGEGAQPDKYFLWNMRGAERGNATAQNSIGFCFDHGIGCEKSQLTATKWFRRAAQNGDPFGWSNLALYYRFGYGGCIRDKEEDFNCLVIAFLLDPSDSREKAISQNHTDWQERFNALGFQPGTNWLELSSLADGGNAAAQCFLGMALYKGKNGATIDKNESRRVLLRSSLGECEWASVLLKAFFNIDDKEVTSGIDMFNLGVDYANNADPQSNDLSFYWYSKAVLNNYTFAYNNLGVCYFEGTGTSEDKVKAVDCYKKAVTLHPDNEYALYNYGRALFFGNGTAKDVGLAKIMLLRSANGGHSGAKRFLEDHFSTEAAGEVAFDNLYIRAYDAKIDNDRIFVKFIVENHDNRKYELWAKSVRSDGEMARSFLRKIVGFFGEFEAEIKIPFQFSSPGSSIGFCIGIDNENGDELFSSSLISLQVDSADSDIDARDLDFTYLSFESKEIFNSNGVAISFEGIDFDEKPPELEFSVENANGDTRDIWIKELYIDGELNAEYVLLGACAGGSSGGFGYALDNSMSLKGEHSILLSLEIDDDDDSELDSTADITISIDFSKETMELTVADEDSGYDDEADLLFME